MKKAKIILCIIATGMLSVGCSNIDKLLKSNDYDTKYQAAMRYYEEGSYSSAVQLFENLTMHYHGKENAENIAWCYANALYKTKDYYTAGYQFRRFVRQYPYSDHVEEASYLSAYCKYLDSPAYSLDQSMTRDAIEEFEGFAERWPRSLHIPDVNRCLDELRTKLMRKEYEIAYGYYRIEEYHAAYEQLKTFVNLYPEAPMREDAVYYILQSGYAFATGSREDKKRERLQQVVADFDQYSSLLTNTKYIADAQQIYTRARAELYEISK